MRSQVAVLVLVAAALQASAWWEAGHMLTAQIALHYLSPAALNTYVYVDQTMYNAFPVSAQWAGSAVWMDDIIPNGNTYFSEAHYISIPFNPDNVTVPPLNPYNIVFALGRAQLLLSNKNADMWSRALMLRIALHLCGDIHQPMHGVTFYSANFTGGDRGGNYYTIYVNGTKSNLHSFWDSVGGSYDWMDYPRPFNQEQQEILNNEALSLEADHPREAFGALINITDPMVWAEESHALAIRYGYLNGTLKVGATVDQQYIDDCIAVARTRITLGGYRLANFLNNNVGPPLPPPPPPPPSVAAPPPAEPYIAPPPAPTNAPAAPSGVSAGAAAGIGVGCFVVGALVCGAIVNVISKRRYQPIPNS